MRGVIDIVIIKISDIFALGSAYGLVETEGLSGRDLYIYVFDGSLVGQDETGRNIGIKIKPI